MTQVNETSLQTPNLYQEESDSSLPQNQSTFDYFVQKEAPLDDLVQGLSHQRNTFDPDDGVYSIHTRPTWISSEEAQWFEETGGLKPAAYLSNNTVTIKLKKPGLSEDEFMDHIIPFNAYQNTATVQTSFECGYNGQRYFYTGTLVSGNFTPVVTKYWTEREGNVVKIIWRQVDQTEAKAVLGTPENKEKLRQNLLDAGVSQSVDSYLKNIHSNLKDLKNVWGSHQYDLESGYYEYQQHVEFNNWLVRNAVHYLGASRLKGAALKIGYLTINEYDRAAPAGQKGDSVSVMGGGKLKPEI